MTKTASHLAVPVTPEDHSDGPQDAPLTLVEYGDYQCPYCGQAYGIVKELQSQFADSLRFVFRNLPLANVHQHAEAAAEMAEAAGTTGKFWEMHDLLYEHQDDLSEQALLGYAAQAGADPAAVTAALATGQPRERVHNDLRGAIRSGANGTPTFFINGDRYDGSWARQPFAEHLEAILRRS
jgi:protein-disulfide isomerase